MAARTNSRQGGFAVVEALVASTLLLVGSAGILTLVDGASATTERTRSREAGTGLQREVVEGARSVAYDLLTPGGVAAQVSRRPGLGDSALGQAGWTVNRRGTTFTLAVGVCSVDDPRDGTGAHDAGVFCPTPSPGTARACATWLQASVAGTAAGTGGVAGVARAGECGIDADADGTVDGLAEAGATLCVLGACSVPADPTPEDYKRVVSLVRWPGGWNLASTSIASPGSAAAPAVLRLTPAVATVTGGTSLGFVADVQPTPATLGLALEGKQVALGQPGAPGTWTATWELGPVSAADGARPAEGEVLDGPHQLGAKAYDRYGQFGASRSVSVAVNRRRPFAPLQVEAGRDGGEVEVEWSPAPEQDVEGHRVYRSIAGGARIEVCGLARRTACRDPSPPGSPLLSYDVVAVDRDATGALREGDRSEAAAVPLANRPPPAPSRLVLTPSAAGPVLSWAAPATPDPDPGDAVDHYLVYRDGSGFADRIDRTDAAELSWTDTGAAGVQHQYRITAVDRHLAQSPMVGPVTG